MGADFVDDPPNRPGKEQAMRHPYVEQLGIKWSERPAGGRSRCTLTVNGAHHNPHGVVHGAVLFAMADTGMGAALYPTLDAGEICATIEVKINYFRPIVSGELACVTGIVNRGKTVANLESSIYLGETLVAKANGNYAIFRPGKSAA